MFDSHDVVYIWRVQRNPIKCECCQGQREYENSLPDLAFLFRSNLSSLKVINRQVKLVGGMDAKISQGF